MHPTLAKDGYLILEFAGVNEPQLESSRFFCPITRRELRCQRGKFAVAAPGIGSFQWTTAVIAFAVAVMKAKVARNVNVVDDSWIKSAGLHGRAGTLAASLDFAISKEPNWLRDIFGVDEEGNSIAKRAFVRRNTEGRREGPTSVAINRSFIAPHLITILRDGEILDDTAIEKLVRVLQTGSQKSSNASGPLIKPSRTEDLEFSIDCLRLPLSHHALGIEQTALSLDDIIVHALTTFVEYSVAGLRHRITCHLRAAIREDAISMALERLMRKGIVRQAENSYVLNRYWLEPRVKLLEAIKQLAINIDAVSLGHSQEAPSIEHSSLCASLRFPSLGSYDRFMLRLLDDVLEEFASQKSMSWQLRHPWWPFVRRVRETDAADYRSKYGTVRYFSKSNTPVDRWTRTFYKNLGVQGFLGKATDFQGDIWLCEDVLVLQYISPEVENEIDAFFDRSKNVDNFDGVQFQKDLFFSPTPTVVRILVAPGLCGIMGGAMDSLANQKVVNS